MASRRHGFFDYVDPYDYYSTSPYGYPDYHLPNVADDFFPNAFYPGRQRPTSAPTPRAPAPTPARNDGFFDVEITESAAREPTPHHGRSESSMKSHPVAAVTRPDPPASRRWVPSVEEAAVRLQAAARGLLARRMVREVRAVEGVAEVVAQWMAANAERLRGDARARVVLGEELMRLVLRLDGVRGAREYRRRVTRRVLALQDAVDAFALEATPPAIVTDAPKAAQDAEEKAGMAVELPVEATSTEEENTLAAETDASTEVAGVSPVVVVGEADDQTEQKLMAEGEKATEEEAAVRLQAAARGLLERRMVREVRAVEGVAEVVAEWVAANAERLLRDAGARVILGEELMRLVLRLDGVRGAREYRRRVTRRVLALQDAVDAFVAVPPAMMTDAPKDQDAEEEAGMAPELPVEATAEEENTLAAETDASTEVAGVSPVVVVGEADDQIEPELVAEGEKATEEEAEWEMVATVASDVSTGEKGPAPAKEQQQHQEQAGEEKKTEVAPVADGLDAKKLMEMVAALCEQSAQQCALMGVLAERVDALESTLRRVEEADRQRRRNKMINKETEKSAEGFYCD